MDRREAVPITGIQIVYFVLPPNNSNEQYYLGEICLGRSNNTLPEEWTICSVSFISSETLQMKFGLNAAVTVNITEDFTFVKGLFTSNIFSMKYRKNEDRLIAQLFMYQLPLQRFNKSIGNIIKKIFATIVDMQIKHKEEINAKCKISESKEIDELYKTIKIVRDTIEIPEIRVSRSSLKSNLRPYQEAAVRWMLLREKQPENAEMLHPLYEEVSLKSGITVYFNKYTGNLTNAKPVRPSLRTGGILADEMGLGKTVEVLACILCHPKTDECDDNLQTEKLENKVNIYNFDSQESPTVQKQPRKREYTEGDSLENIKPKMPKLPQKWASKKSNTRVALELLRYQNMLQDCCGYTDMKGSIMCTDCKEYQHSTCLGYENCLGNYRCPKCWMQQPLLESKATLIVCPISLRNRWCEEIHKHVGHAFNVLVYEGTKAAPVYPTKLKDYDLVLTTYYNVLQNEQVITLRGDPRYSAPGSPLSVVKWWRLCLDEAQTVGVPSCIISSMTKKLHAHHRWVITSTPICRDISDLYGLIDYLQIEPFNDLETWKRILYIPYLSGNIDPMLMFLAQIMWRSSKNDVIKQVKNKHIMKFKSYRTNKENGASNSVVKQQKSSRDEVALINSKSILQELPFELPHYCSEEDIDTDSAFCSDSHTTSVLASTINGKTNPSRQDIQSVMSTTSSSVEEMKIKLEPVVISSDEDFEPTPRKKTKRMSTKTTLSEEETIVRVKSYLQQKEKEETQNKTKGKVNRKLYTLQTAKKCKPMVEETAGFKLRVRKDLLAQKSSSVLKISTISIGVHRPTTIVTSPQKSKPYILEKKNSNTELRLPTSEIAEASCSTSNSFLKNCSVSPITRTTSTPIGSPNTPPKNPITLDKSPNTPRKSPSITPKKNLRNLPKKTPRRRGSVQVKSENDGTVEDEWSPLALRLIRKIMQYISSHDHLKTLLSEQEMQMLNRFCQMPKDEYMFFCIKLYTRIQKWYNIFKLSALVKLTMSDPEVRVMYMYLSENGFVDTDYSSESCGSLLNHLLQKEIKDICESFRLKLSTSKKPDMIQKLLENCNRQSTLTFAKSTEQILKERIKDKMGYCVKLNPSFLSLLKKLHVLYAFTTSDFQSVNDLYLFMIRILTGEIVMPEMPVDTNFKVFPSVTEFSIFADAYECKRALLEAIDKKEVEHMRELCILAYSELKTLLQHPQPERPAYLNRFTAGSKYTTALSVGTKNLAKHHPNEVQEWLIFLLNQNQYGQQLRGLWYDSLIMVQYFYLKQYNDATETLINALSSTDLSEVAIYDLSYRAEAIKRSKAHKVTTLQYDRICFVQPTPLHDFPAIEINARAIHDNESGKKRQYLERTENGQNVFNVEQVALNHYLQNGFTDGVHCEGSLLATILFILFWDIIYDSNVPGVFIGEIQYLPLDLWSKDFYLNRKKLIDQRLEEITSKWPLSKLEDFVMDMWKNHSHEKSLVNDKLVEGPEQLFEVMLCIGRKMLAQILERMVKSFKTYHSGLPDLFLWNFNERTCKFVEVKGEKDKLSTKQKLWLKFLLSINADAEVCHVHTVGSKYRASFKRKIKNDAKKEEKKPNDLI